MLVKPEMLRFKSRSTWVCEDSMVSQDVDLELRVTAGLRNEEHLGL